jgi:hypothetical protein
LDADHVVGLSLFKYNNQLVLTWRARQEADLHAAPLMVYGWISNNGSIFKSSNCTIYGLWISTNGSVYGTTSSKFLKMNCKLTMLCRFILPTILLDMGCHCPNNSANIKSNKRKTKQLHRRLVCLETSRRTVSSAWGGDEPKLSARAAPNMPQQQSQACCNCKD